MDHFRILTEITRISQNHEKFHRRSSSHFADDQESGEETPHYHSKLVQNRKLRIPLIRYRTMGEAKAKNGSKIAEIAGENSLSMGDFLKLEPWDLRHKMNRKIVTAFTFVPDKFKNGPWIPAATWSLFIAYCLVVYLTIDANIAYYASSDGNTGIMNEFIGDKTYPAFTVEWYYNVTLFFWMSYIMWLIYSTYRSIGPWVTFTVLSWTMMTTRHGLCALAPFVPSVRLLIGILRFSVLLTASVTFVVWNFALMPLLTFVLLKGEKRKGFLKFAFSWRLCQIHLFNIVYAYLNCVWAEPKSQGLHIGDINAAVVYLLTYILFYYCILDRMGVQLYPIFSPRTYMCLPSLVMAIGLCYYNYVFWDKILTGQDEINREDGISFYDMILLF